MKNANNFKFSNFFEFPVVQKLPLIVLGIPGTNTIGVAIVAVLYTQQIFNFQSLFTGFSNLEVVFCILVGMELHTAPKMKKSKSCSNESNELLIIKVLNTQYSLITTNSQQYNSKRQHNRQIQHQLSFIRSRERIFHPSTTFGNSCEPFSNQGFPQQVVVHVANPRILYT